MNNEITQAKKFFENGIKNLNNGDFLDAENNFRLSLTLAPNRSSVLLNLSSSLIAQERWNEAIEFLVTLLSISPGDQEALLNLGICQSAMGNFKAAISTLNTLIKKNPSAESAWTNLGYLYLEDGDLENASLSFEKALLLNPKLVPALIGSGNLRNELQDYETGLHFFNLAQSIQPNNPLVRWNKALSLLRLGKYEEGWKLYEARQALPNMKNNFRQLNTPVWLGEESLKNKTIFIYPEQGYGDVIQTSRYLPLLEKTYSAKVIFEAPDALFDLMKSLSPTIEVVQPNSNLTSFDPIDFNCPIMSLPFAFKTRLSSIPNSTPYIFADPLKVALWQDLIKRESKNLIRIGITWSGSGHYAGKKSEKRNLPFGEVRQLISQLEKYPIEFHSLQIEPPQDSHSQASSSKILIDHSNQIKDFSDTAALISNLDLIISIDTATLHLAGALNKPTLALIPTPPDFMALLDQTGSPWYPNTTLIRQPYPGIWDIPLLTQLIKDKLNLIF